MADYGFDGMVKVSFVPTIASISAPTTTELNAGTPLEGRLLPDGLATGSDTAEVDTGKLNSTFNTAVVGRRSFTLSVTYVRGSDTAATAVETALVYKAAGYLVVRRDVLATTAYASAQKVEVYPVQVRQPNPANPGPNALQSVEVGFTLTGDPKGFADPATIAGP